MKSLRSPPPFLPPNPTTNNRMVSRSGHGSIRALPQPPPNKSAANLLSTSPFSPPTTKPIMRYSTKLPQSDACGVHAPVPSRVKWTSSPTFSQTIYTRSPAREHRKPATNTKTNTRMLLSIRRLPIATNRTKCPGFSSKTPRPKRSLAFGTIVGWTFPYCLHARIPFSIILATISNCS